MPPLLHSGKRTRALWAIDEVLTGFQRFLPPFKVLSLQDRALDLSSFAFLSPFWNSSFPIMLLPTPDPFP